MYVPHTRGEAFLCIHLAKHQESDYHEHQLPALLLAEAFQFIITVIQIYPHCHCIIFDQLLNCRHHLLFISVHYYSHPNTPSLSLLNFRPVAKLQTPFILLAIVNDELLRHTQWYFRGKSDTREREREREKE